jgi:hypothetical protein
MPHQHHDLNGDDQAQVWRCAQHRRTEDIRAWFADIFGKRRQLKSPDARWYFAAALFRSLTSQRLLPSGHGAAGSGKGDSATGGQSGQ